MQIIGFFGKGGVGKTTLSCAAAKGCSQYGKTALLMADQQNNALLYDYNITPVEIVQLDTTKIDDMLEPVILKSPLKHIIDELPDYARDFVVITSICAWLLEAEKNGWQFVIIDFPPNHALSMMGIMDIMHTSAMKWVTMKYRVKRMVKGSDLVLDNANEIERIVRAAKKILLGMECYPVALMDRVAIIEAQKTVTELTRLGFTCNTIILNRWMDNYTDDCDVCFYNYQRQMDLNGNIKQYITSDVATYLVREANIFLNIVQDVTEILF